MSVEDKLRTIASNHRESVNRWKTEWTAYFSNFSSLNSWFEDFVGETVFTLKSSTGRAKAVPKLWSYKHPFEYPQPPYSFYVLMIGNTPVENIGHLPLGETTGGFVLPSKMDQETLREVAKHALLLPTSNLKPDKSPRGLELRQLQKELYAQAEAAYENKAQDMKERQDAYAEERKLERKKLIEKALGYQTQLDSLNLVLNGAPVTAKLIKDREGLCLQIERDTPQDGDRVYCNRLIQLDSPIYSIYNLDEQIAGLLDDLYITLVGEDYGNPEDIDWDTIE